MDLGWSHPEVVDAVRAQLGRTPLPSQELIDPLRGVLARLLGQIPGDLKYSWFCASSTETIEAALKIAKLNEIVAVAVELKLPLNIGTEMNKQGLPFVDDLDGEALRPHKEVFLRGARLFVGHSVLARYAGFGYVGEKADAEFGHDLAARNTFFEQVGGQPALSASSGRASARSRSMRSRARLTVPSRRARRRSSDSSRRRSSTVARIPCGAVSRRRWAKLRIANSPSCVEARNKLGDMMAPGSNAPRDQVRAQQAFVDEHCRSPIR